MKKTYLVYFRGLSAVVQIRAYNVEDAKGRALLSVLDTFGRLDIERIVQQ